MKKLLIVAFVLFSTNAIAEENWFQKQWSEIVEYQKVSWAEGKEQLANNKIQIQELYEKVKGYVTQD